jgi:large subunit ribosomal protein L23
MALLDFLKRKKQADKAKEAKKSARPVKKTERVLDEKKPARHDAAASGGEVKVEKTQTKKTGAFSYEIIKEPHISEKGTILSETLNQYVFKVYTRANKLEIKKAVEGIYGVTVLNVNVVKIPPKKRRLGRHEGFKKAFTKAIVKVKEGDKIEIL